MGSEATEYEFRVIRPEDIEQAYVLEKEGYPEDEAACYESLVYRQREAPSLFVGCFEGSELLGFICSTKYPGPRLKQEAMEEHRPDADCVCVHSVCVASSKRRRGVGLRLLRHYVKHVKETEANAKTIVLICKSHLIPLYTRGGFLFIGKSEIQHGKDSWYDMECTL